MKHFFIIISLIMSLYSCNLKHKTLDTYLTIDEKTELAYGDMLYLKVFSFESECKTIISDFKYNPTPDTIKQEYLTLMQNISYYDVYKYYTFINKTNQNIAKYKSYNYTKLIKKFSKYTIDTEQYKIKKLNKLHHKYPLVHKLRILHLKKNTK